MIKLIINESLNEYVDTSNLKDVLIRRIPFLKEYNIFKHPRYKDRLEAQRVTFNEDVQMMMGDEILNFEQFNVSSNVIYDTHVVNDNTFYSFTIKNELIPTHPEEMDDLTFKVFIMMLKKTEEKLSYHKEVMIQKGEGFPKSELDAIINDMNGILFKIEEFTQKHSINLF